MKLAICRDYAKLANGVEESFSARWADLAAKRGIEVVEVDPRDPDPLSRVRGCNGFLWRFFDQPVDRLVGKRLLPAIEHGLGLPVFPNWRTIWHYDDKVAQHHLLSAAGIPTPRTWVFWQAERAREFCRGATYPLVLKLATGASSLNVRLVRSVEEAEVWIGRIFGPGVFTLEEAATGRRALRRRLRPAASYWLRGRTPDPGPRYDLQKDCLLLQEFLPGNEFDTRVTVIGDRAFGFRRFNRPNDFRASGSGRIDHDPSAVDEATVRLAFRVARALGTQSVAIDGLRRGEERVVGEISYTYLGWYVQECPGHWVLHGDPENGSLEWRAGKVWPEAAIFEDFLAAVGSRSDH